MKWNGLIQAKEEGWTGISEGWQGCSEGFPEGKAQGKSRGEALPAQGKPRPSRLNTWIYILFKVGQFCDISDLNSSHACVEAMRSRKLSKV